MNRKGQFQPFYLFMLGVIIFIIVLSLAVPLIRTSNISRTQLDCSNSSISASQQINCTVVDTIAPFIILVIIGIGAIAFGSKVMGG